MDYGEQNYVAGALDTISIIEKFLQEREKAMIYMHGGAIQQALFSKLERMRAELEKDKEEM